MCGFLGQYSFKQASKEFFLDNLAVAKHRGPDQTGYWGNDQVQLGFNRLAIVDLSEAGHQPMHSNMGNWVIVFNGEIYNHLELREQFPNYNFRGHSDTETLVAGFESWGFEETIKRLIGMFAIAAYNIPSRKLFFARDSVGIKPLFYSINPNNLWFASQFNQIIKGLGKNNVNLFPEGIRDYMQFGYMQAPNTIYKNIKQLEPGQMAIIDESNIVLKRFCHYPEKETDSERFDNSHESLNTFNKLFSEVCRDQLRADVPVGTFLSSGIDATLVSAFSKLHKPNLKAYTIGLDNSDSDERPKATEYAKALGIQHVCQSIASDDLSKTLSEQFLKLGEPFGDFSSIPTYLICNKAKEHSTVMLGGDGGDELFWGYDRFQKYTKSYPMFKDSLFLRRFKKKIGLLRKRSSNAIFEFETVDEMVINGHSHISIGWSDSMFPNVSNTSETRNVYNFKGQTQKEFRDWLRYNEFYAHMQRVLTKVDRMSMANSLEVRVPFLDQRIVDFAWSLHSDFGLSRSSVLKPFLKRVLSQHIPLETMNNNKKGFYIPIRDWLKGELKEEVQTLLLDSPILGEEYINRNVWKTYVNEFYVKGRWGNEWGIWIMYSWQKWKEHLDSL